MFSEIRKLGSRQYNGHMLPPMPGITSSSSDQAKEKELCSIDFYGATMALCPKIWSTR